MQEIDRYRDIIDLPHHRSSTEPHMSEYDRAAQFSPFAALKGYDDEIDEAARFTEVQSEPDDDRMLAINAVLVALKANIGARPKVHIRYFRADERKEGGSFETYTGRLVRIDEVRRRLVTEEGAIPFDRLVEIEPSD